MARIAKYSRWELEAAKALLARAKNIQELRQSQSVLLPALAGLTLEKTAELLGLSRDRVVVLRREFRNAKGVPVLEERRGGRRHQLLMPEEEKAFLLPWIEKASQGGVIVVPPLHAALEARVGHRVPKSTIYRLLARHGWRKLAPDTRHPKKDEQAQEDFKKNFPKS